MTLRQYQRDALTALDRDWGAGYRRLGVALPTGTGKTHVMAELARTAAAQVRRPGAVLVLVHRDALVDQTERRFRQHVAGDRLTVGVVKANRNVVGANIVIASIWTLRTAARRLALHAPTLVIVDEAHVSMSDTFQTLFDMLGGVHVAGFSATWTRTDKRKLGDFWEKISYQRGIRWAIREGHLVMPRAQLIGMPEGTLNGVRTRAGDYLDSDLGPAVSIEEIRTNVVRAYHQHAAGRPGVLFAPTHDSAEYFRQALQASGVPAAGVYDRTTLRTRRAIFDAHRRGTVKVLTTCTALAEGWDAPWCSVALKVRPTKSVGRYIQEIGRVLRPWPGKRDALVLEMAGTGEGLSLDLQAVLQATTPTAEDLIVDPDSVDPEEVAEQSQADVEQDPLLFRVAVGTRPVDLFAGTRAHWLTTVHGVPFVATSSSLYFLCETELGWNVGTCSKGTLRGGRWLLEGAEAAEALEYASVVAVDDDSTVAGREASWRRGNNRPTTDQINYARSIGVGVSPDDTKLSLSDKITLAHANQTLAPIGARQ